MSGQVGHESLVDVINSAENIVIAGHVKPDGDCIGAALGLALALRSKNKNVYALFPSYQENYDIIPGKELIAEKNYVDQLDIDLFIAVDCAEEHRLGEYHQYFRKAKRTINIDHHISNTFYAGLNHVKSDASSTCEIIFNLVTGYYALTKNIASALFAGIMYDTCGLKHPNTKKETLRVVGCLYEFDIEFSKIMEKILYSHSVSKARLLARVIEKMQITPCNQVIYSSISKKDFDETGSTIMETEGIVGYLLSTDGISVAVFFYEDSDDSIKVSFRSNGDYDVSQVAIKFKGGGHINACACIVNDSLENTIKAVLEEIYNLVIGTE